MSEKEEETLKLREQLHDKQMEIERLNPVVQDLQKNLDDAVQVIAVWFRPFN